jgi:hypothetical protein
MWKREITNERGKRKDETRGIGEKKERGGD